MERKATRLEVEDIPTPSRVAAHNRRCIRQLLYLGWIRTLRFVCCLDNKSAAIKSDFVEWKIRVPDLLCEHGLARASRPSPYHPAPAGGNREGLPAVFRHDASRELDPQLHSHHVVANGTLSKGGKRYSLETREL